MTEPDSAQEIERKFRVEPDALPFSLEGRSASRIEQGYLAVEGAQAREVRIRNRDGHYTLTTKTGHGEVRGEGEVALSAEQFQTLWPFTEGRRIAKTRYEIDLAELTAELDIYASRHTGLAVVEVEFADEVAARRFDPPDWFGDEVTDNAVYKNQRLALALGPPE
ncbi:MAG: CYTH domain-containing protein [Chromatocurvus sp.]